MKKQNISTKSEVGGEAVSAPPKPRAVYTDRFKRDAVARMREDGVNASMLAEELGIRRNQLYKWEKALAKLEPSAVLRSWPCFPSSVPASPLADLTAWALPV